MQPADPLRTLAPAHSLRGRLVVGFLNLMASIQFAWFYVNRVPPHIHLSAFEQGLERTPFQYRLLMMFPMRWAHSSPFICHLAARLNAMPGWFPNGVRPEGLVQAPIDLACIVIAGWVARRLYQGSSCTGFLTPFAYPLTLLMATTTYSLLTMHQVRFIYDLPSLAFFSLGLYLIFFRRHPLLIVALFIVATINRETTLFLLLFFAVAECREGSVIRWKRLLTAKTLTVLSACLMFWLAWHHDVSVRFAGNPNAGVPRVSLNLWLILFPITWPQILGACGYLLPLMLLFRRDIAHPLMRLWLWILPAWFAFMLYFGIVLETRLFGELIPYVACAALLICEERLLGRIHRFSTHMAQQSE